MRLVGAAVIVVSSGCLDRLGLPDAVPGGESLSALEENMRPGTSAWDGPGAPDSVISGFGLPFSLSSGDTLHVFLSARRTPLSISVYRLGWYGGAGGRLIERHMGVHAAEQGPCSPLAPGPLVCDWSETDRFVVDGRWVPGVYVARFADSLGRARAFQFVVRAKQPAAFVVVLPFATYQAYNPWGGANLYRGAGASVADSYAHRAVQVSFARPYADPVYQNAFLAVDYLLVRWLEQHAYDVSYVTDYDFHLGRGADPQVAWLFAGHFEYWTWPMWLRANASRARGISLGFLGGNDIDWVIRYESAAVNRLDVPVVTCYRDVSLDPDGAIPGQATVRFRSPPNNTPENSLVGVMTSYRGVLRTYPVDLVVADGADPLFAGTGLSTGDHIPRVAGWEADRIVDNGLTPAGIRTLFESPYVPLGDSVPSGVMQATIYTSPVSGAVVFAAGEPGFAWGLSTYRRWVMRPAIDRLLQNVLQAFLAAPGHH